jgi:hypothetical protein
MLSNEHVEIIRSMKRRLDTREMTSDNDWQDNECHPESAKTVPLEMLIAVRQDLPVCATRDQMQEIAARYGYTVSEDKEEGR